MQELYPLYVQQQIGRQLVGQPELLTSYVLKIDVPPFYNFNNISQREREANPEWQHLYKKQQVWAIKRNTALDRIARDILGPRPLNKEDIKVLFPIDIENIRAFGDNYLLQLVTDRQGNDTSSNLCSRQQEHSDSSGGQEKRAGLDMKKVPKELPASDYSIPLHYLHALLLPPHLPKIPDYVHTKKRERDRGFSR